MMSSFASDGSVESQSASAFPAAASAASAGKSPPV
jgi:hypothetical protein